MRFEREGWSTSTIFRIAHDLREALLDMRGFSLRNLKCSCAFAAAWPSRRSCNAPLHKSPRGSNLALLRDCPPEVRIWHACKAADQGWGRGMLESSDLPAPE